MNTFCFSKKRVRKRRIHTFGTNYQKSFIIWKFPCNIQKKAARKKFFDYTRRAGIAIAAAAFVILFIKATDFVEHSNYAKVIISVDSHGEVAPVNSIKLVDGITNPYISDTAKPLLLTTEHKEKLEKWEPRLYWELSFR